MLFTTSSSIRVAVYGRETTTPGRGVGLWSAGYKGNLTAAGAEARFLNPAEGDRTWEESLAGTVGVVVCGYEADLQGDVESLCLWCRENRFPLLAIDQGLLAMNQAFGGCNYQDLPRELPEALQHRHPPEPGLRHALNVQPDTVLAGIYGEGEIVVNSEHRQAIQRVASGFRISGTALDGVIEAIESVRDDWFALGVQWQPAAASASGLDIQVFRALIEAQTRPSPRQAPTRKPRRLAMAG